MNKFLLTASHVRYLLALKRLHGTKGIKCAAIAEELKLSRPSVHNMMDTFLFMNYIEKATGGKVFLTEFGLEKAAFFEEKYHRIKGRLFSDNSEDDSVDRAICAMLAELSKEAISKLL